jgi:dihydrofolate synthase/folylpolyglutamate synthase
MAMHLQNKLESLFIIFHYPNKLNYPETLDWMFGKLPMYQRQGNSAFKKDLTNSIAFAERLKNPQNQFKSIHVAGTNGKGSTTHMIASVLQEAGYKVGLYTSPHLKDFRERIKINGEPVSKAFVIDFIAIHKDFLENQKLSFFEMTVGMAFNYFAIEKVDFAVVEVGLGGRLDSTNILQPLVSVITNIGFDHMQFLGETLAEIAGEKAGIIKPNTPVIIGEFQQETFPVFEAVAKKNIAPIFLAEKLIPNAYTTDLQGNYQLKNIKTAVQCLEILKENGVKISEKKLHLGLRNVVKNTGLKGRWQVLRKNPKVVCDTAHNKEGLILVLQQIQKEKFQKLHIVLGFVNDKDLNSVLLLFPKNATYYFCKPDLPRGLEAAILQKKAAEFELFGGIFSSVLKAYEKALNEATENDFIYVGGSTFVVAEMPI